MSCIPHLFISIVKHSRPFTLAGNVVGRGDTPVYSGAVAFLFESRKRHWRETKREPFPRPFRVPAHLSSRLPLISDKIACRDVPTSHRNHAPSCEAGMKNSAIVPLASEPRASRDIRDTLSGDSACPGQTGSRRVKRFARLDAISIERGECRANIRYVCERRYFAQYHI